MELGTSDVEVLRKPCFHTSPSHSNSILSSGTIADLPSVNTHLHSPLGDPVLKVVVNSHPPFKIATCSLTCLSSPLPYMTSLPHLVFCCNKDINQTRKKPAKDRAPV